MLGFERGAATWTQRLSGSFRYRGYRQLFAGSMLAQTVFRMNDVILGWQMLQLTNSAFWVGLVAFASGIPLLIFSPFTGMLADQRERHHIVAIGLAGSAAAMLWLAWLQCGGARSAAAHCADGFSDWQRIHVLLAGSSGHAA